MNRNDICFASKKFNNDHSVAENDDALKEEVLSKYSDAINEVLGK